MSFTASLPSPVRPEAGVLSHHLLPLLLRDLVLAQVEVGRDLHLLVAQLVLSPPSHDLPFGTITNSMPMLFVNVGGSLAHSAVPFDLAQRQCLLQLVDSGCGDLRFL